jgi:hypothetical protein
MGDIIINVEALICEAPIFTHTEWTGIRYEFSIDWTSNGDDYFLIDPTTNLELSMEIVEVSNNVTVYTGVVDSSVPFNATGYIFNVLDYYQGFSSKYKLILTLSLTSQAACNISNSYTLPIDYP